MMKQKLIPYTRVLPGDNETPITLYMKYVGEGTGFLLESRESGKGRYSFIGKDPFATIKGKNDEVQIVNNNREEKRKGRILDIVKEFMDDIHVENSTIIPFTGGGVGTIAYDIIRQYERLPDKNPDLLGLPDVHLMFVKNFIVYDHFHDQIILVALDEDTEEGRSKADRQIEKMYMELLQKKELVPDIKDFGISAAKDVNIIPTKAEFIENVKKARGYIYEGDIFQVVISQRCRLKTEDDSFTLYRKLRALNPSAYLFYLNFESYQVVGSSPEMLVEVKKDNILTCPIAGTRPRGRDEKEDENLSKELLNDEKERAEHVMLVDLARNDMGRVSTIGSVNVPEFMNVKYYSHVMHIVSLVGGRKEKSQDAFSILSTFLPAGTLSGAPKIRAMEIIDELESVRRGLYGGTVGYFGFDGNMDMCIAIRMMIVKDKEVYLQAGAGIVADSDPESEYIEVQNKLGALMKVAGGYKNDTTDR